MGPGPALGRGPNYWSTRLINARAEAAPTKPAFRLALARRRCLAPADGYYEWQRVENGTRRGGRQPYWITRNDQDVLALAGLWETWGDETGALVRTVARITTSAAADVGFIHDRMPVILEAADWERWLDRGSTETGAVAELLAPAALGTLRCHAVSTRVNKATADGPELIEAVDPADGIGPRASVAPTLGI